MLNYCWPWAFLKLQPHSSDCFCCVTIVRELLIRSMQSNILYLPRFLVRCPSMSFEGARAVLLCFTLSTARDLSFYNNFAWAEVAEL